MPETFEFSSFINSEKLQELVKIYKFPLIFSLAGIVLLVTAVFMLISSQKVEPEVPEVLSVATKSAERKIKVDIAGAVISPGVFEFSVGERISDALVKAGGLSGSADREWVAKNLNRAAKLVDGGKIYIPSVNELTEGKNPNDKIQMSNQIQNPNDKSSDLLGVTTGKVNINTASQKELDELPGVGEVTAGKIISGRPYQSIEELKSKKTVGNALFEKIRDLIIAQ